MLLVRNSIQIPSFPIENDGPDGAQMAQDFCGEVEQNFLIDLRVEEHIQAFKLDHKINNNHMPLLPLSSFFMISNTKAKMSPRTATAMAACLLATAASPAAGFAPSSARRTASPSALQMSSTHHATEDMYPALLNKASLCAHSDTCSIDGAESYLREIVHIQSGCAAGTLSGNAVCEDVLGVSEVVADLREKIRKGAKQEVK